MDQTAQRQQARNDRVHGAEGIIPLPLWLVLFVISGGDLRLHAVLRRQRPSGALTQAMLMGSVTVVITLLMLLLGFFDNPHGDGLGQLQPTEMERTLRLIDAELNGRRAHRHDPPCDERGNAIARGEPCRVPAGGRVTRITTLTSSTQAGKSSWHPLLRVGGDEQQEGDGIAEQ